MSKSISKVENMYLVFFMEVNIIFKTLFVRLYIGGAIHKQAAQIIHREHNHPQGYASSQNFM